MPIRKASRTIPVDRLHHIRRTRRYRKAMQALPRSGVDRHAMGHQDVDDFRPARADGRLERRLRPDGEHVRAKRIDAVRIAAGRDLPDDRSMIVKRRGFRQRQRSPRQNVGTLPATAVTTMTALNTTATSAGTARRSRARRGSASRSRPPERRWVHPSVVVHVEQAIGPARNEPGVDDRHRQRLIAHVQDEGPDGRIRWPGPAALHGVGIDAQSL